ncbi:ComF family protein [Thermodesulfobacteriota bacterium]
MNPFSSLLDIIYPPRCHICMDFLNNKSEETPGICDACSQSFKEISHPYCSTCGIPFISKADEDHLCGKCIVKKPYYDEMRAPYLYEGPIMGAIQRIKYSGRSYLANSLGLLLGEFARTWLGNTGDMILLPVPLHVKRLRQRGFNQSMLLAEKINKVLCTHLDYRTLERTRNTDTQTGLKFKERQRNVKGAFEVSNNLKIRGKDIILVDDVATTGNTINECARVLKKAGCNRVYGLVLARTAVY